MKSSRTNLGLRVLNLAKPETKTLLLGTLFLAANSGASLLFPQMIRGIVDKALTTGDVEQVNNASIWLLLVLIATGLTGAIRHWFFTVAGERVVLKLRERLYEHILKLDVSYFDANRTGDLMSRLSSDCTVLQNTVSVNISMGLRNSAGAIGGLSLMVMTSPKLAAAMLAVIPPIAISAGIFGRRVRGLSKQSQEALADASNVAEETLSGLRTVRSFSQESWEASRYAKSLATALVVTKKRIGNIASFIGFSSVIGYSAVAAVLWYGGRLVAVKELSVGDLTQFLIYLMIVGFSVGSLGSLWGDFMAAVGAASRVFDILDRKPLVENDRGKILDHVRGAIEFKNVSFSYPQRSDVPVLNDISFHLEPGQSVALVGPSGSGKTTVAGLLQRFYDPLAGTISIDGHILTTLQPNWVRRQIGTVSQEPVLMSTSIAENIRYGKTEATAAEIKIAAQLANAAEFIDAFPEGYQTLVGERGIQLSGGQKQRVAIARAILKDPKILILDEATSALDSESEHLVQEALTRLMVGRTTLIIAHRLATIRSASMIIVLENGRILETGRHEQLILQTSGAYSKLISRQLFH